MAESAKSWQRAPKTFHLLPFVPGMDVRSILKQVLHSADPVEAGSKVKRGGIAALRVTAVDIVRRAQTLEGGAETRGMGSMVKLCYRVEIKFSCGLHENLYIIPGLCILLHTPDQYHAWMGYVEDMQQ